MEILPQNLGRALGQKPLNAPQGLAPAARFGQAHWTGRLATGIAREFRALQKEQQERAFFATTKGQSYNAF